MKRIIISCILLLAIIASFGQVTPNQTTSDSTQIKAEKLAKRHLKHKKFILAADTLSKSDYLLSIDRVNDNLIDIRDSAKLDFEIVRLKDHIEDITTDFNRMKSNFREKHLRMSVKNLTLYKTFATSLDEENDRTMDQLQKLYLRVYHAKLRLKIVLKDSVFKRMYADSLLRSSFEYKLIPLERKWEGTDSITKLNIDSINALKILAVDNSINLTNMMSRLDRKLENANHNLLGRELPVLWKSFSDSTSTVLASYAGSEQRAIVYYIGQTWQQRIYVIVIGLLLFIWLFMKRKLLKDIRQQKEKYKFLNLNYLSVHPILSISVVLLSLMPFFDAYAPTSYVAFEFLLVLGFASIIFFKTDNRNLRLNWLALNALFIADTLSYVFAAPSATTRIWMLLLQMLVIGFTFGYYKKTDKATKFSYWIKAASVVGILLAVLSIIANLSGRFSLSCLLGTAAIVVVTEIKVLSIFVETILDIILIQLVSSRNKKGIHQPFDGLAVIQKITMPVLLVAAALWLIMLSSCLNVYHSASDSLIDSLTMNRTIGSISFKLISVVLFFVIIWVAHILQRLLSFLFGEVGTENEEPSIISKGQHSRLLITRLLVLIGGYMLAIAASGLPIDKLTFLLGALGVGIGMGLQNVVNNFVSGIILIFDGSLQIGDEIEVSGQAGKVKEIGLRASTLNTADGAEVIIPNGTILSQNIVNWTFSNDQKRVSIEFSLKGEELDANEINEIINVTIKGVPHVIEKRKPIILFNKVTSEGCTLTVRFWTTISKVEPVKSDAMLYLNKAFAEKNIGFV